MLQISMTEIDTKVWRNQAILKILFILFEILIFSLIKIIKYSAGRIC